MRYLLPELLNSIDKTLAEKIQLLWLYLWPQPEGRGFSQVILNLNLAVLHEQSQLLQRPDISDQEKEYAKELEDWSVALDALEIACTKLNESWQEIVDPEKDTHPVSRYGFTANGIYAGCWNLHEAFAQSTPDVLNAQIAYRCVQWLCVRAQSELISNLNVELSDYEAWFGLPDGPEPSESMLDFFQKKHGVLTHSVGLALRDLSLARNQPLLQLIHDCCDADLYQSMQRVQTLADDSDKWSIPEYEQQTEREKIMNALRLFFDKLNEPDFRARRNRRRRGLGGPTREGGGRYGGFVPTPKLIRNVIQPESLPDLEGWVTSQEIDLQPESEEEAEDGTEAPGYSGLTLFNPKDVAGHLARQRTQQHYMAMLRQGFAWDSAALADSERLALLQLLQGLHELPTPEPEAQARWLAQAMVGTSWLLGRNFEAIVELRVLNAQELAVSDVGLAVCLHNGQGLWRLPLRMPKHQRSEFTDRLDRIDHIVVVDSSGLAARIVEVHSQRDVKTDRVFSWARKPAERIRQAEQVLQKIDQSCGSGLRMKPALVERDLRLALFNLTTDRTIAWMLAGAAQDANQPRMFYAAHAPAELARWMERAHQCMGIPVRSQDSSADGIDVCISRASSTPLTQYAGAKFLPDIKQLCSISSSLRMSAQNGPNASQRRLAPKFKAQKKGSAQPDAEHGGWDTIEAWRAWHDHTVLWVWWVQSLQTGMRAIKHCSGLYYQYLLDPTQTWLSLEDKVTRDHDESRASLLTPCLRKAYEILTEVQEAYHHRWGSPDGGRKGRSAHSRRPGFEAHDMPFGFMIFGTHKRAVPLRPAWMKQELLTRFKVDWPVNFARALMRRVLAEQGLDGDALDAFMGHGAMAERVHDRHSLFDFSAYGDQLERALAQWAEFVQLHEPRMRVVLPERSARYRAHRKRALIELKQVLGIAREKPVPKSDKGLEAGAPTDSFDAWCKKIAQLKGLYTTPASLSQMRPWYDLLGESDLEFSRYLLRQSNALEPDGAVGSVEEAEFRVLHEMHAKELQAFLVDAVTTTRLVRVQAARGFNLAYTICQALNKSMPTMDIAMTSPARVSPFTLNRLASAGRADRWRRACRSVLVEGSSTSEDLDKAKVGLAAFLNVTAHPVRWAACMQHLGQPSRVAVHAMAQPYGYTVPGRMRKQLPVRAFMEGLSSYVHVTQAFKGLDLTASRIEPDVLFRHSRAPLEGRRIRLSRFATDIHWWSRLLLPPLIAEHLAGNQDDQSAAGPLTELFGWPELPSQGRRRPTEHAKDLVEADELAIEVPTVLPTEAAGDPPGWSLKLKHRETDAGQWLRSQLLAQMGGTADGAVAVDKEVLNETLVNAYLHAPSMHRRKVRSLVLAIQKREGLAGDDLLDIPDSQVDRQVLDFERYHKLLDAFERTVVTGRHPQRQRRMRMLIVMGFRFGMRRREILGLRRMDVDLIGGGRVHIRPYAGHSLKTSFSKRSLPIDGLLPERELAWLKELCADLPPEKGLFPHHEHDMLSRDAIKELRRLGGNKTLKLHHLRHSFASHMALKVVLARHPQWVELFANFPNTYAELRSSAQLVNTVLRPQPSAGEFLVIARLLGHSSYEVTLSNYVHTLDVVSALFMNHVLPEQVLPKRDWVSFLNLRYQACIDLQASAMRPLSAASTSAVHKTGVVTASLPVVTRGACLQASLVQLLQQCREGEGREAVPPDKEEGSAVDGGLSCEALKNWFSPRQALRLRDRLVTAWDGLQDTDLTLLAHLYQFRWSSATSIIWFEAQPAAAQLPRKRGRPKVRQGVQRPLSEDLIGLLALLRRLEFGDNDVVFWRYDGASADEHKKIWADAIQAAGWTYKVERRSGNAHSAERLGVSLRCGTVKRSVLLGVWLGALECEQRAPQAH